MHSENSAMERSTQQYIQNRTFDEIAMATWKSE
jgi:hypothetical protein